MYKALLDSLKASTHSAREKKVELVTHTTKSFSCIGGPNNCFMVEGNILGSGENQISEPIKFLLDTGSSSAVLVTKAIADNLGITKLPLVKTIKSQLADGSISDLSVYKGTLVLQDIHISTLISVVDCGDYFAVIGTPFLNHFDLHISKGKCQLVRR